MTKKELIKELEEVDDDARIYFNDSECGRLEVVGISLLPKRRRDRSYGDYPEQIRDACLEGE